MDQNNPNPQTNLPNQNQVPEPTVPETEIDDKQAVNGMRELVVDEQPAVPTVPAEPSVPSQPPIADNSPTSEESAPTMPAPPNVEPASPIIDDQPPVVEASVIAPSPVNSELASPLIDNKELVGASNAPVLDSVSETAQSPSPFDRASAPVSVDIEQNNTLLNNSAPFSLPTDQNQTISPAPENNRPVPMMSEEIKPKGKAWPWVVSIIAGVAIIIAALFYFYDITITF